MLGEQQARWTARYALSHPLWWASLAVLLLNDHYLKGRGVLTAAVTGKLSDFAGMLMAPLVIATLLRACTPWRFALAHGVVGLGFTTLKLSVVVAELWCSLGRQLGWHWRVVADPSDLAALPLLLVSYWAFGPRLRQMKVGVTWQRWARSAGLGMGLAGILATSRAPPRAPVLGPHAVYLRAGQHQIQELERSRGTPGRKLACDLGWGRAEVSGDFLVEQVLSGPLRACDLMRGRPAWERELDEAAELVASDGRHILLRSSDRVWALAAQSGAVLWQIEAANRGVVLLDDRVLVRSQSDRLLAHSLSDGRRTAAPSLALPSSRPFANIKHPLGVLLAQVEYPQDGVDAIDAVRGNLLWRLAEPTTAAAANSLLVFTYEGSSCANNALTARLAQTGQPVWSIPWCPSLSNVSADGDLVVTSSYESEWSWVVARRPADGELLWSRWLEP